MKKMEKLQGILRDMKSVLLAYSGGVDSTFLLKAAIDVLGDRVLAVTAVSQTYTEEEREMACEIAASFNARHMLITTDELAYPNFRENPPDRCYYCKTELFGKLREIADGEDIDFVIDASNIDDCSDFRPGRKAAQELSVRSPIIEAGLTKDDIRALSREMGLPTWDKPSAACLASRFPYGERITEEKLKRVEQAEKLLRQMGFAQVRVRSHGDIARIEVAPDKIHELADPELRARIIEEFKSLGIAYITLDLEGYRTGSMNEILPDAGDGG